MLVLLLVLVVLAALTLRGWRSHQRDAERGLRAARRIRRQHERRTAWLASH